MMSKLAIFPRVNTPRVNGDILMKEALTKIAIKTEDGVKKGAY